MTLIFVEIKYTAIPVCAVATFAAIQEGHLIRMGKKSNYKSSRKWTGEK